MPERKDGTMRGTEGTRPNTRSARPRQVGAGVPVERGLQARRGADVHVPLRHSLTRSTPDTSAVTAGASTESGSTPGAGTRDQAAGDVRNDVLPSGEATGKRKDRAGQSDKPTDKGSKEPSAGARSGGSESKGPDAGGGDHNEPPGGPPVTPSGEAGDEGDPRRIKLSREIITGDQGATFYGRFWNTLATNMTREEVNFEPPQDRPTVVLSLGCGIWKEAEATAAYFGGEDTNGPRTQVESHGVDIDETSLRVPRARLADDSGELPSQFKIHKGDASNLASIPGIPEKADIVEIRDPKIIADQKLWKKIFQEGLSRMTDDGVMLLSTFTPIEHGMVIDAIQDLDGELVVNEENQYWTFRTAGTVSFFDRYVAVVKKKPADGNVPEENAAITEGREQGEVVFPGSASDERARVPGTIEPTAIASTEAAIPAYELIFQNGATVVQMGQEFTYDSIALLNNGSIATAEDWKDLSGQELVRAVTTISQLVERNTNITAYENGELDMDKAEGAMVLGFQVIDLFNAAKKAAQEGKFDIADVGVFLDYVESNPEDGPRKPFTNAVSELLFVTIHQTHPELLSRAYEEQLINSAAITSAEQDIAVTTGGQGDLEIPENFSPQETTMYRSLVDRGLSPNVIPQIIEFANRVKDGLQNSQSESQTPQLDLPEYPNPNEVAQHLLSVAGPIDITDAEHGAVHCTSLEVVKAILTYGVIPGLISPVEEESHRMQRDISVYPTPELYRLYPDTLRPLFPYSLAMMADQSGEAKNEAIAYADVIARDHALLSMLGIPISERMEYSEGMDQVLSEDGFPELEILGIPAAEITRLREAVHNRKGFVITFSPQIADEPGVTLAKGDYGTGDLAVRPGERHLRYGLITGIEALGEDETAFLENLRIEANDPYLEPRTRLSEILGGIHPDSALFQGVLAQTHHNLAFALIEYADIKRKSGEKLTEAEKQERRDSFEKWNVISEPHLHSEYREDFINGIDAADQALIDYLSAGPELPEDFDQMSGDIALDRRIAAARVLIGDLDKLRQGIPIVKKNVISDGKTGSARKNVVEEEDLVLDTLTVDVERPEPPVGWKGKEYILTSNSGRSLKLVVSPPLMYGERNITTYVSNDNETRKIPGTTTALYTKALEVMQAEADEMGVLLRYTLRTNNETMMEWALDAERGGAIFEWEDVSDLRGHSRKKIQTQGHIFNATVVIHPRVEG